MSTLPSMDVNMAMNSVAEQDMQAQRRAIESLAKNKDDPKVKEEKLRSACEGFESVFIQKMWEQMRASLPKDGLMSSSKEEAFWQGMYDQELAKSMTSAGGIGLADMMMKQMSTNTNNASDASKVSPNRNRGLTIPPAPLIESETDVSLQTQNTTNEVQAKPQTLVQPQQQTQQAQQAQQPTPVQNVAVQNTIPTPATPKPATPVQNPVNPQSIQVNNAPIMANIYEGEAAQPLAQDIPAEPVELAVNQNVVNSQNVDNTNAQNQNITQPPQEPIVTRVTYQTNLPPNQRKAMPNVNQFLTNAQNLQQPTLAVPVQANNIQPAPSLQPPVQPVQVAQVKEAPKSEPLILPKGVPHPDNDILAGITQSYIRPSKQNNDVRVNNYIATNLLNQASLQPTRAGGPDLSQPRAITATTELGTPNPERGSMQSPVEGKVSSGFGWRLDPLTGKRSWHNGVDIAAQPYAPVRAADAGIVSFVGSDPELGNLVVVDHPNGFSTFYGHNGEVNAEVGEIVEKGTEIAKAGTSGRTQGSHVHFEIRRADLPINPESVLYQQLPYYTTQLTAQNMR